MTEAVKRVNNLERTDEKKEKRIKQGAVLFVLLAATVFFYFAVIRNIFGGTIWDIGVYGVGAVLFAIILGIWIWQLPLLDMLRGMREEEIQRDIVQICCFACICLMTLYYYNSGSEYGHSIGTRVMNSAFGIALLCMCKKEDLQNRRIGYVQLCLAALFIAGTFWRSRDSKEMVLYVLSGITVWIYIRLLGSGRALIGWKEIRRRISAYGWLVFVFFAGLVVFRNTRTWPFSIVIPFGWLYLYHFDTKKMNRLLKNYCYGCILAFWMMVGSGALFRPYYSFEFIRYPGWFSSVATAGLFWMLVIACTISCILAKVDQEEKIIVRRIYFEWITLGVAGIYLFMTLSRTAALSVAVFCFSAFVLVEICYYRDSLKGMVNKIFLIVKPACSVADQHIRISGPGCGYGIIDDCSRVGTLLLCDDLHSCPVGPLGQLFDGSRPESVRRRHKNVFILVFVPRRKFADSSGLASAVYPDNKYHRRL